MLFALSVLPDNAAASLVDQLAPATKPNKCCLTVNCEDSFSLMPIEPDPIAICAQPFDSPCVCVLLPPMSVLALKYGNLPLISVQEPPKIEAGLVEFIEL